MPAEPFFRVEREGGAAALLLAQRGEPLLRGARHRRDRTLGCGDGAAEANSTGKSGGEETSCHAGILAPWPTHRPPEFGGRGAAVGERFRLGGPNHVPGNLGI